jgi:hypothetical protein
MASAVEGRVVERTSVVKCALRRALNLDDRQFVQFSALVEEQVLGASRALRRASLVLLHRLIACAERGQQVPDVRAWSETDWKDLLRLDTPAYANRAGPFPQWCSVDIAPGDRGGCEASVRVTSAVDACGGVYQKLDDQVANYAGHTLRTVVLNNAWVPLVQRITRLVKLELKTRSCSEPKAYRVVSAIRAKEPDLDGYPSWLIDLVAEVRNRLNVRPGKCVHDTYGDDDRDIAFPQLFEFNYWLQQRFESLGARRLALSPVIDVRRAHVRLDRKLLLSWSRKLFGGSHPRVKALDAMQQAHDADRAAGGYGYADPADCPGLLPRPPLGLDMSKRKRDCATDEEWQEHCEQKKAYDAARKAAKSSEPYARQAERRARFLAAQDALIGLLFTPISTKMRGKDWAFDGSLVTDGVSVSLQYSRTVVLQGDGDKRGKRVRTVPRGKAVTRAAETEGDEEYDRRLSTWARLPAGVTPQEDVLVLGVDPGRTNLATVAYVLDERSGRLHREAPRKKSWTLSRAQYYAISGIRAASKDTVRWRSGLAPMYASLCKDGASLRTSRTRDVELYLDRYASMREEWWAVATKLRESRQRLGLYAGKRRALDGFFSRVRREAQQLFPTASLKVGYGEAGLSMKPTGRCETAVPTSGTYRACCRAFPRGTVVPVDETNTTAVGWASGKQHLVVYTDGTESRPLLLAAAGSKAAPVARAEHVAAVRALLDRARLKRAEVFGPAVRVPDGGGQKQNDKKEKPLRYPVVRGLRFCPERRMFLARDVEAATAIARLRLLELSGRSRPRPFMRRASIR